MTQRSSQARSRVQQNERLGERQWLRPRAKTWSDAHADDVNGGMQHRGDRDPVGHGQILRPVGAGAKDCACAQATTSRYVVRMDEDLDTVAIII